VASPQSSGPANGWVLYDRECGFCARWIKFWLPTFKRHGFAVSGLQEQPWAEQLRLPLEQLLSDIRLLKNNGRLFSGADAYLQVARAIWWAWPFYAVFSLSGFNQLLHAVYRWVARNRYCISHSCNLTP
jgi:predicted DCC family thiol-disulfide oxidoreductase YuxK